MTKSVSYYAYLVVYLCPGHFSFGFVWNYYNVSQRLLYT